MSSPRLYTLHEHATLRGGGVVHLIERIGATVRVMTPCGYRRPESDVWATSEAVTCQKCLAVATCARGHQICGTPELCERLATGAPTVSLTATVCSEDYPVTSDAEGTMTDVCGWVAYGRLGGEHPDA